MPQAQPVPKAARPVRPFISQPSIVVCHEKHGERYFLVNNDEDLFRVALSVLKGRFKSDWGWFYEPQAPPVAPGFTAEDIEKLPKALQADAQKKLTSYQQTLRATQNARAEWEELKKAAEGTDGRAAWQVLRNNSDGEYARISIERLDTEYDV